MRGKGFFFLSLLFGVAGASYAQLQNGDVWKTDLDRSQVREVIRIPDIEGYVTLKCDFHVHTVFSDGKVWPDVRVDEAWQQGLDAIAVTDHIEVRPLKETITGDLNESCRIARKRADQIGFILIHGSEITRDKPLGHLNALFLTDANPLDTEDPLKAIDVAREQGAVILWNHPGWPDDRSTLYDVHERLIAGKKIDMIEVHNYMEYYPLTFDWVTEFDLAPSANTDTHQPVSSEFGTEKMARPMTLVFAEERSEAGIKKALVERRTAALFNNIVMAKREWAEKLFWVSVKYRIVSVDGTTATVEVENVSDIPFVVRKSTNERVTLPAGKIIRTGFTAPGRVTVENVFTGYRKNLTLDLPVE
jgi:predicted metal-dependent phosphoesterase TrpH